MRAAGSKLRAAVDATAPVAVAARSDPGKALPVSSLFGYDPAQGLWSRPSGDPRSVEQSS
jgi:hypothetical protein